MSDSAAGAAAVGDDAQVRPDATYARERRAAGRAGAERRPVRGHEHRKPTTTARIQEMHVLRVHLVIESGRHLGGRIVSVQPEVGQMSVQPEVGQ